MCKKISDPVSHCMWGSFEPFIASVDARCLRCNDGYAVNHQTQQCEKPSQPGCWINASAGKCFQCNPYLGYSMLADGNCYKTGSAASLDVIEKEVRKLLSGQFWA